MGLQLYLKPLLDRTIAEKEERDIINSY